jgi:hypothetical protein
MRSEKDEERVAPHAQVMIESLRAYGYSPATAIADLIDNSIAAEAKNIWIRFHWAGKESYISVLDDGLGMDDATLSKAMRPGSRSPSEERGPNDLGRFGMGLKTASFSQCRRLTVRSKMNSGESGIRRWDIDYVRETNDWLLLKTAPPETEKRMTSLDALPHGTIVLWEYMDWLLGQIPDLDESEGQSRFYAITDEVRAYLEMVFHVFLEGSNPSLKIFINGSDTQNQLKPWDPFCTTLAATDPSPVERIICGKGEVSIQGYILPHKDKMKPEEYEKAAGLGGWNARQGFYIYRNSRLLVAGGWLGLGQGKTWIQEEQYKLARIRVDFPSSLDSDWQIDVKKSTAKPPLLCRSRLITIAEKIRTEARKVFAYRGQYEPRDNSFEILRIWKGHRCNGRLSYKIDRKHHLIAAMEKVLITDYHKDVFRSLLRTIEETVPIAQIWLDTAESADNHARPFDTDNSLENRQMLRLSYRILRENRGLSAEAARLELSKMEEFRYVPQFIKELED